MHIERKSPFEPVFGNSTPNDTRKHVSCMYQCLQRIIAERPLKNQIQNFRSAAIAFVRPYHVEKTGSRPITEVKQRQAWLEFRWVTAWEHHVI